MQCKFIEDKILFDSIFQNMRDRFICPISKAKSDPVPFTPEEQFANGTQRNNRVIIERVFGMFYIVYVLKFH